MYQTRGCFSDQGGSAFEQTTYKLIWQLQRSESFDLASKFNILLVRDGDYFYSVTKLLLDLDKLIFVLCFMSSFSLVALILINSYLLPLEREES